ncbi:hypothetical protein C6356_07930 [Bacillus wiedmannii]|uniref:restriction endonuclease n=1 Tax=Bacillus wiedmannii TaxID=1890302 RepID=UPI000D08C7F4|nr:restriction endonuclease [Bacillus wiedmannii]PRT08273.1 hypothetical protein C6356_07930 [Bacillus wiedmannii]
MGKINSTNIKKLCNYITEYYSDKNQILEDYFSDFSEEIICKSGVSITSDEFIETLCDSTSKEFLKLVEQLNILLEEQGESSKVALEYSPPYYYIRNTEFGKNSHNGKYGELLTKLDFVFNQITDNGMFYQKFCCMFLNDLGIKSFETPQSGDNGIDIISEVNINFENEILNHFIQKTMLLLVQVKFHQAEIDSSVIRHIIGDSLFYKFSKSNIMSKPIQLAVISHRGFTLKARQLAGNHGIILIDSKKMIDLLLNNESPQQLSSINYLNCCYDQFMD